MANLRSLTMALSFVAFGWALFHPRVLVFFALVATPLVVLWLCWRYRSAFTIDDAVGKDPERTDLTGTLFMPGLILALWAMVDVKLVNPKLVVVPALLALCPLMFAITRIAPVYRGKLGRLVLMSVFMSAYPASTICLANKLFDQRAVRQHVLPLLGKHQTTGKGAANLLNIPAWIPGGDIIEARVPLQLYDSTKVGDNICLTLHPGAFGLRWYVVDAVSSCTLKGTHER